MEYSYIDHLKITKFDGEKSSLINSDNITDLNKELYLVGGIISPFLNNTYNATKISIDPDLSALNTSAITAGSLLKYDKDMFTIGNTVLNNSATLSDGLTTIFAENFSPQLSAVSLIKSNSEVSYSVSCESKNTLTLSATNLFRVGSENSLEERLIALENVVFKDQTQDMPKFFKNMASKLAAVSLRLEKYFLGAFLTLNTNNCDKVGQVAQSLTRLIEELPLCLVEESKLTTITNKKDRICKALCAIAESEIDSNDLISKQHYYYTTLSNMRHNKTIYQENDEQFQSYIMEVFMFINNLICK